MELYEAIGQEALLGILSHLFFIAITFYALQAFMTEKLFKKNRVFGQANSLIYFKEFVSFFHKFIGLHASKDFIIPFVWPFELCIKKLLKVVFCSYIFGYVLEANWLLVIHKKKLIAYNK